MQTSTPFPSHSNIVYAYGSPSDTFYGELILAKDGTILGYNHPRERFWRFSGTVLELLSEAGSVTSRYKAAGDNVFIGNVIDSVGPEGYKMSRWKMLLAPVLDLSDIYYTPRGDESSPTILINTIPKSGTYFLSAALELLGCPFTGLHLTDDLRQGLFDFRGLSLQQRDLDPGFARINVSIPLAFCAMRNQHAVAHIHERATLSELIGNTDGLVINVVRNLRDCLRSLYFFKLRQVPALDESDKVWRSAPENERFPAFLLHFFHSDIRNLYRVGESIASIEKWPPVRYEDLFNASEDGYPTQLIDYFSAAQFKRALVAVRDAPTATLSPREQRRAIKWTSECESIFKESGLLDLNRHFQYEK